MNILYRPTIIPENKSVDYILDGINIYIPQQYLTSSFPINTENALYLETKIQSLIIKRKKTNPRFIPYDSFYIRFSKPIFSFYVFSLKQFLVPDIIKKLIITLINGFIETYNTDEYIVPKNTSLYLKLNYHLHLNTIPKNKIFESLFPNFS